MNENSRDHLFLAIDLKSFYASVECVTRGLDPLTANLLVADESRTDGTICLAVSPSLKALGVPGRPRLYEAKEKIKLAEARLGRHIDYIIACPHMSRYIEYSARVYSVYLRYFSAEDIHVYSVDEVFIDIEPYKELYAMSPASLAMMVVKDILKETGITATCGIGNNLYLSKIAMDIVAKPLPADENGVRIASLNEEEYRKLLWGHMPITDFWQIAGGISRKLYKHGMYTMGDIANMSLKNEELFYELFGVNGELIIDHAWGLESCTMEDIKSYHTGNRSLSNGQVLPRPYDYDMALLAVKEQAEILALQLIGEHLASDSMTMYIGYEICSPDYEGEKKLNYYGKTVPGYSYGTERFGTYISYASVIIDTAGRLYARITKPGLQIRRIFVTLNNVMPEDAINYQFDIFHDYDKLEKEKKLEQAVLSVRAKYGANSLLRGMNLSDGAMTITRNKQIGGHRS